MVSLYYNFYRNHEAYEPIDGSNIATVDPYEDMTTSNHVIQSPDPDEDDDEEIGHSYSSSSSAAGGT
jgi:hypothetical protein